MVARQLDRSQRPNTRELQPSTLEYRGQQHSCLCEEDDGYDQLETEALLRMSGSWTWCPLLFLWLEVTEVHPDTGTDLQQRHGDTRVRVNLVSGHFAPMQSLRSNMALVPTSRSHFKQRQIPPFRTLTNVLRFCVNFWVIQFWEF